jgi:ATP-dependent phosphofructokinase / diphosphate-dependent phosphofructokinase
MAKRIAILTGGGDCPGLNAAIRAVVKHARNVFGWDVIGIEDGFEGLYYKRWQELSLQSVAGLLPRGGTILGSSNRGNPEAFPIRLPNGKEEVVDVTTECLANLSGLDVEALVVVGGDGTMSMAKAFHDRGVPIVGIPKTIDNDLEATDYSIGFATAVETATDALDRLHTTAESHDRVMICEVMGRYAGWIALTAGLASGADIILLPEIDYDIDKVVKTIRGRATRGLSFSIVVVAEGAKPAGGQLAVVRAADKTQQEKLGGAGQRLAEQLASRVEYQVRCTVLGHILRGGPPCAFDRVLATRFGSRAVELIAERRFGTVAALHGSDIVVEPIEKATRKLKQVDPDGDLVRAARAIGIEFGA